MVSLLKIGGNGSEVYQTLCQWVKYYFLCAVQGAGDYAQESVYTCDELRVVWV